MCESVLETSALIRVTHGKTIDHERDGSLVLRRSGHSQHFENRRPHPYQKGETRWSAPFDNQVLTYLRCSRGTRDHQHLAERKRSVCEDRRVIPHRGIERVERTGIRQKWAIRDVSILVRSLSGFNHSFILVLLLCLKI